MEKKIKNKKNGDEKCYKIQFWEIKKKKNNETGTVKIFKKFQPLSLFSEKNSTTWMKIENFSNKIENLLYENKWNVRTYAPWIPSMPGRIPSLPWWQREGGRTSRWNDSKPTGSNRKIKMKKI